MFEKSNEFHCPNCNELLDAKTFSGKYSCPSCGKKYIVSLDFLRSIPFILIVVILPSMLFDYLIDKIEFIQHKFLFSTILLIIYVFILLVTGASRFIMEKFKIIKLKENIDDGTRK